MTKFLKLIAGVVMTCAVAALVLSVALYLVEITTDPARDRISAADALVEEAAARDRVETNRQQAEIERQQAQQWQGYQAAYIAPAQAFLAASLPAAGGVITWSLTAALALLVIGGAGLLLMAAWERRQPLIWPNRSGALPVARHTITNGTMTGTAVALLETAAETRQLAAVGAAQKQPVPQSLTYSPHLVIKQDHAPALPAPEPEAPAAFQPPTFADLLARGQVGQGRPLLLGYDARSGEPLQGSWLDLYSTALGGVSGSGKSTTARYLLAQAALLGCKFAVIDPHAGAGSDSLAATLAPLSSLMVCQPASDDKSILDTAKFIRDLGRRRLNGQDKDTTPVVLAVDEATALLSRSTIAGELAELLEEISQELRKRHIFALCSAQIWIAARSGGSSALRDSFASAFVHRMKRQQARLIVPSGEAAMVERLATGQALLWRTSGESQVVTVPLTTGHDIDSVARLIGQPITSRQQADNKPIPMLTQDADSWVTLPDVGCGSQDENSPDLVSAEALQVARLFIEGVEPAQIVLNLRGISTKEGTRYRAALAEIHQLMRAGMPHILRGQP